MKFLLNMNVRRELAYRLTLQGHVCRHVGEVGLARASDSTILTEARKNGEIIITHDLDYGHLLAFAGEKSPSVIIFRLFNSHPQNLWRRLQECLSKIENLLVEGVIVLVEETTIRIRNLPLHRDLESQ